MGISVTIKQTYMYSSPDAQKPTPGPKLLPKQKKPGTKHGHPDPRYYKIKMTRNAQYRKYSKAQRPSEDAE